MSSKIDRREFLGATSAVTAAMVVPRHVLGGPAYVPPSEKTTIAFIGCGTQGIRQLMPLLERDDARVVAVCDPNRDSYDYVEWGKNEIRNKIRNFLGDSNWGANDPGCRCGLEVGRELVDKHYSKISGKKSSCDTYADFREMLEKQKDLDACYIMTPEHLHATIGIRSMEAGKHVVTHKPIANTLYEVRRMVDTAKKTKRATHLFCAADNQSTPTIAEWIAADAIGPVRQVHNWSSRPFWPQGMIERPKGTKVPDGMNWDLWLGPVEHVDYNLTYTHAVFRGWYDFGSGALGDMGHYSMYQIFKILKLGVPISVEAGRSQYWAIEGGTWSKKINELSYPRASTIHWEFDARDNMPAVDMYWYDGGMRPPLPKELEVDGKQLPAEGLMFVGDKGKILAGFTGTDPQIIPEQKMKDFKQPPQTLPRPIGEVDQWLRGCRGEQPSDARFEITGKLSETVNLGNIALRVDKKLAWNTEKMQFTNAPEANKYIKRKYRKGWEL